MTEANTRKPRGGNRRTPKARGLAQVREMEAIRLRAEGKTYQEIADALGYADPKAAYSAFQRARKDAINESADEIRDNLLNMIGTVAAAHLEKARGTTGDPDPRSAEVVLKAAAQVSKMLGLDAPQRVESTITHFDGSGSDLDRTILELAARFDQGSAGEVTSALGLSGQEEPAGTPR